MNVRKSNLPSCALTSILKPDSCILVSDSHARCNLFPEEYVLLGVATPECLRIRLDLVLLPS